MTKAPTAEEKRSAIKSSGIMVDLAPQLPPTLRIALSEKQNFALVAEEIFNHALTRTVWNYRDNYDAVEFILKAIKDTAIESVPTEAGIHRISDIVFGDTGMREFIFQLQVQFIPQMAEFHNYWNELVKTLAGAFTTGIVSTEPNSVGQSLVPSEITSRQYDAKFMNDLLATNTWLLMFLLVLLWGKTLSYDEIRAYQRKQLP